jgi:hypothetical protein
MILLSIKKLEIILQGKQAWKIFTVQSKMKKRLTEMVSCAG